MTVNNLEEMRHHVDRVYCHLDYTKMGGFDGDHWDWGTLMSDNMVGALVAI